MKAGIYKRVGDGKHVYVAKDRGIRAFQLTDVHPHDGTCKVSTSEKGQVITFRSVSEYGEAVDVIAHRVADVPNGCTDPVGALHAYVTSGTPSAVETLRSDTQGEEGNPDHPPRFSARAQAVLDQSAVGSAAMTAIGNAVHELAEQGAVTVIDDEITVHDHEKWTAAIEAAGLTSRPYPKDTTIGAMLLDVEDREVDALYPYQREAIRRFEEGGFYTGGTPSVREGEVAVRIGEAGTTEYLPRHERETEKPRLGLVALDFAEAEKLVEACRLAHPDIYGVMAGHVFKGKSATGRVLSMPAVLGAPYRFRPSQLERWPHCSPRDYGSEEVLRECGWRPVHRQSARKHRRKGHAVKFAHGRYWWRAQA